MRLKFNERFMDRFERLVIDKGYLNGRHFLNQWIKDGGTFKSLHEWLLSQGLEYDRYWVWLALRPLLTIPYNYDDAFIYRWNAIAKTKGFESAKSMFAYYTRKKYNKVKIAEIFDTTASNIVKIMHKVRTHNLSISLRKRKQYSRKKRRMRSKDGFGKKDVQDKWSEKFKSFGNSRSLREVIWKMQRKNMTPKEMAHVLGVDIRTLYYRLVKAKLKLTDKKNKPNWIKHGKNGRY
jgi:hypothetical protein